MSQQDTERESKASLIDLLSAMDAYFTARRELNEAMAAYDGYSFSYYGAHLIDACEDALHRVEREFARATGATVAAIFNLPASKESSTF